MSSSSTRLPSDPRGAAPRALWVKDLLAILADDAERGVVVEDGVIVELSAAGGEPTRPATVFDAGVHGVLPGPKPSIWRRCKTGTNTLPWR